MTVAAVIPHWNRADLLPVLFGSLKAQTRPFDRIIVVDNGSTDESVRVAEQSADVTRLDRNLGFAAAVNRGIEAAAGADWIAILNNDVTLEPDWLERLLDAADAPPDKNEAWFATGKILSARDSSLIDGCFDEISRGACAYRCGSGRPDAPYWSQARTIRIAPMTAALFRRRLFDEVGLLDEAFGSYLEDVDFGLRCAEAARSGVYEPRAVAHHQGGATWGSWNKDTVRSIARNQILLAAKHFRGQPRWPIAVGQLLWGLIALRHGRGAAYLRGKIEGIKQARAIPCNTRSISTIDHIVGESERNILEIQRQTGFDGYWRAYFCLARP